MKMFSYVIKDEIGIHARPAGELVKKAKEFSSELVIDKNGNKADLKKLFQVLKLGVKCGESVDISAAGSDEEAAAAALQAFLEANL
jgi:phosphocarrier protein